MFEIADRLLAAVAPGRRIAIATAVAIDGSAPRTIGTSMAFDGETVIGSIAGGCVEGAVIAVCEQVLQDGIPQVVEYGVSDETAFSVGLTCGGQLRVDVRLLSDAALDSLAEVTAGRPTGLASVVGAAGCYYETRIAAELEARIALGRSGLAFIECDSELVEVFFEVSVPRAHLIVFGAMEYSAALSVAAQQLGFRVTVCDPRALFATTIRFPGAEVVVSWPTTWLRSADVDDRTVICVLSHDARFDAELIELALASPATYVGAMGSRLTHDRRIASLKERNVNDEQLSRLHSPIGLDLGASTVEETAIAILAEVISSRTKSSTASLATTSGAIHAAVSA